MILIDAATEEFDTYALMITQDGATTTSIGRWGEVLTLPCNPPSEEELEGCSTY